MIDACASGANTVIMIQPRYASQSLGKFATDLTGFWLTEIRGAIATDRSILGYFSDRVFGFSTANTGLGVFAALTNCIWIAFK
jgi:hypothetical protein